MRRLRLRKRTRGSAPRRHLADDQAGTGDAVEQLAVRLRVGTLHTPGEDGNRDALDGQGSRCAAASIPKAAPDTTVKSRSQRPAARSEATLSP